MSGLVAVAIFLITIFFNLFLFALWVRIGLRYFGVSTRHPVGELIYTYTNPIVSVIDRIINIKTTSLRYYDWAAFVVIIIVELVKVLLITLLVQGGLLPGAYLLVFVLGDLVIQPCNLLFYLVLFRVIISWVNPLWYHPAVDIIRLFTDPLIAAGRRVIPNISGFDFAPFIILIILEVITLFIRSSFPFNL